MPPIVLPLTVVLNTDAFSIVPLHDAAIVPAIPLFEVTVLFFTITLLIVPPFLFVRIPAYITLATALS